MPLTSTPLFSDSSASPWLVAMVGLALLAVLGIIYLLRRRGGVWHQLRRDIRRSPLMRRVLITFGIVTIFPTVMLAIFSGLLFNLGVQAWFNERVQLAVGESLAVAEAYLEEHRANIRADALAMASDINRFSGLFYADPIEYNRRVSSQASTRRLTEVIVFQGNRVIAQGRLSFSLAFESIPVAALRRAAEGEVVILSDTVGVEDKVRALVKLDSLHDAYLLVGRLVDDQVIQHIDNTRGAVTEYRSLLDQASAQQALFTLAFVAVSSVLLALAIWYGLVFATRLTTPISRLAYAAERVRGGDYETRVYVKQNKEDELTDLSATFNRMVEQLEAQRQRLITTNLALDERRRFSETVLSGVSAGVLALDAGKRVRLSNRSAQLMLDVAPEAIEGMAINELLPGLSEVLLDADQLPSGEVAKGTISIERKRSTMTLHVRVAVESARQEAEADKVIEGYIVTLDDISPLVAAQRNAAWADVARRVAHEIKNPLTPIALSAERIRRKYHKLVEGEEAETFARYTDTIARHVADIGRMVDEFVSFARMPGALMKPVDMHAILKTVMFSEQVAHPDIRYTLEAEPAPIALLGDERQLAQAFTNLLKNAAEAMEASAKNAPPQLHMRIHPLPPRADGAKGLQITLEDNGTGFPPEQISQLFEPYVTTRTKGTGLGLAIVKRIIEEHKGSITLQNRAEGGARVMLSFWQHCDINAADQGVVN